MSDYPGFDFIQARWQYGGFPGGYPKYLMAHSLECRHMRGIARSLAGIPGVGGWMQDPNEQHSVQTMTDPSEGVQDVHNSIVALHCGGGNNKALGNEHTGYTADDVATWNSPAALTMLSISAKNFAWQWVHVIMPLNGVTYLPEWLSLAQIADGSLCGLITHNDSRIVFGGTTHTDPGPNFPYQVLRDSIHAEIRVLLGIAPPPPPKPPSGEFTMDAEAKAAIQALSDKLDRVLKVFSDATGDGIAGGFPATIKTILHLVQGDQNLDAQDLKVDQAQLAQQQANFNALNRIEKAKAAPQAGPVA